MRANGPPVFLDYDQAALDAAYHQAAYAPNREQLIERRISESKLATAHRRTRARRLRTSRDRAARDLSRRAGCGLGLHLHPRWRLAQRPRAGFRPVNPRADISRRSR